MDSAGASILTMPRNEPNPAGTDENAEDVRLMRTNLLTGIQIKAAGGIQSHKEALQMLQAGASRLGTSSGIQIIQEASQT